MAGDQQVQTEKVRPRYSDRVQAGYELASELRRYLHGQDPILLAIPRGGVPVAAALATDLDAQLDLIITRKIIAKGEPDTALGAITPDRTLVVNRALASQLDLTDEELDELSIPVWAEVQRIQQLYRKGKPYPDLRGRTVVLVDDRLTTGYTMMAAVVSARKLEPERVIVAVPVSSLEGIERVRGYADEVLSLELSPDAQVPASRYYATWAPVTDQEVIWTVDRFWSEHPVHGYSETF